MRASRRGDGARRRAGSRLSPAFGRDPAVMPDRDRVVGADMNVAPQRLALNEAVPIKRATPADARPIAAIFAAAFAEDPVFTWLARAGKKREQVLERFFLWILQRTIPHGETWLDLDGLAAAAWIPPVLETAPPS